MDCSRRGSDGSASLVHRLTLHAVCGLLVALYALGMSMPALAGGGTLLPPNQPIPESIRWVNGTPSGVDTSANASMTNSTGQRSHHKFRVPISAATLGALANGFVRRGVPYVGAALMLKDLINGAGWAIDELQGQVVHPGVPQEPLGDFAFCIVDHNGQFRCASGPGMLSAVAHLVSSPGNYQQPCRAGAVFGSHGERMYMCIRPVDMAEVGVFIDQRIAQPTSGWDGYINDGHYVPSEPISNVDLGNLIKHTPQVVNAVLIDPHTGAPIMTPELTAALNDLRRTFESANGLPPGTDLEPVEDYSQHQPSQTDWPEFCGWAKRVCDWMFDLDPEPENPELPYHEVEPELEDFDIGLGQGTCPAPYTTSVLDGEFEIQWDGLCGFVEYLRPLMIGLAWVVAAFIVANSAKRA